MSSALYQRLMVCNIFLLQKYERVLDCSRLRWSVEKISLLIFFFISSSHVFCRVRLVVFVLAGDKLFVLRTTSVSLYTFYHQLMVCLFFYFFLTDRKEIRKRLWLLWTSFLYLKTPQFHSISHHCCVLEKSFQTCPYVSGRGGGTLSPTNSVNSIIRLSFRSDISPSFKASVWYHV